MNEAEFRKNLAKNIAAYRKSAGLTQGALAEKLNYSDKSVSKWERAEGMPDAFVLYSMAKLFGVSVDELTGTAPRKKKEKKVSINKYIIPVLSVLIVWLTAAVAFFAFGLLPFPIEKAWLAFIFAIPVSFIVFTVFSCLWHGMLLRCISVSGIIWGVFMCLILTFNPRKMLPFVIVASILQVMTMLWFIMRKSKAGDAQDENSTDEE